MSKRKLGLAILTALLCVCMAMFLVACGTQGEKGEKGEAGKDGISIVSVEKIDSEGLVDTYEITYSDGKTTTFTVTNGANGEDGKDGSQVSIGENGNWFIDGVDTGIAAKGTDGEDGTDGSNGEDGKDGNTPYIKDGNWWIGDKDTGVKATGENGSAGQNGKSAYEIAVENGFEGTEEEWLESLKGKNGADGKDGASITSVEISEDGKMLYFYSGEALISSVDISSLKGEDGKDGANGADGEDAPKITGISFSDGKLIFQFSSGEPLSVDIPLLKGDKGETGAAGTNGSGYENLKIDENGIITVDFVSGDGSRETLQLGTIVNGKDGIDGRGIKEISFDEDTFEMKITYTDDTFVTFTIPKIEGTIWYNGSADPENGLGKNGDYFLNTSSCDIFYKENSVWSFIVNIKGASGTPGEDGIDGIDGVGIKEVRTENREDGLYLILTFTGKVEGADENNQIEILIVPKISDENASSYEFPANSRFSEIRDNAVSVSGLFYDEVYFELDNGISIFTFNSLKSKNITFYTDNGNGTGWDSSQVLDTVTLYNIKTGDNYFWMFAEDTKEFSRLTIHVREIFTISFEGIEETFLVEEGHSLSESEYTLPTAEKFGYTFSHWNHNEAEFDPDMIITENITLKPVFVENEGVLIFYSEGEEFSRKTVFSNDIIEDFSDITPTKEGYHLLGWSKTEGGETIQSFEVGLIDVGDELKLYTVWEANINTLHFDGNGATSGAMEDMTIATDASANLTANAFERKGYTFEGWSTTSNGDVEYADGAQYTMGTESDTLYAVWEANTYSITTEGDSIQVTAKSFDEEALQNLMDTTYKLEPGSQFLGWGLEVDGGLNTTTEIKEHFMKVFKNIQLYPIYGTSSFEYDSNDSNRITKYTGETGENIVVYIPDNVTTIGSYTFNIEGGIIFDSIVFGKYSTTKKIEDSGFSVHSSGLKVSSITFPKTLETFGSSYNVHCDNLINVDIGAEDDNSFISNNMVVLNGTLVFAVGSDISVDNENITEIKGDAIQPTVTKLFLKVGIDKISRYFNTSYPSIQDIYFEGTEEQWTTLVNKNSLASEISFKQDCEIHFDCSSLPEA